MLCNDGSTRTDESRPQNFSCMKSRSHTYRAPNFPVAGWQPEKLIAVLFVVIVWTTVDQFLPGTQIAGRVYIACPHPFMPHACSSQPGLILAPDLGHLLL